MKRRRVVKLFSLSMAGMLAISPCNMAGNVVYAENMQEEMSSETESEEGTEKASSETESEEGKEEVSSETESGAETNIEEATTEIFDEEVALFEFASESVILTQFYGKELEFDCTSNWSDQGENQLELKSEKALNSGAIVSFDMYIPEEMADYNGVIKVQGIARLGDNWTWTENSSIPEFTAANLAEIVEIDGKLYKKSKVSFTFGDENTTDYLANFTVKLAG